MPSQQNSSDFAFGGYWNQSTSQFSASSAHYGEAEDASRTTLSYSFGPPVPLFGDRDAYENMPSTRPSLSSPSGTASTVTIPPVQAISAEYRQPPLHHFSTTGSIQTDTTYERSTQQPTKARKSMPRAPNFTSLDWERHHDEIKRL
ncbi:hypothetical protein BGZ60DRAFT_529622 [Tricladium varicosporioides]|nr:hypothetical protein BGZ60DRAFT_529622 [Hymenoscyphus varicosporioides]